MAIKFLNTVAVDNDVLYVDASANKVGIGTDSPTKNLNLQWNSSNVNPQTGEGLSGGTTGTGVLLRNSNTTVGTFANLDFRANNADARIAVTNNATDTGDFHFILDNTTATPKTRLFIQGETGNVGIGTIIPQDALDIDWDTEGVATNNSGIRVRAYRPHLNLIDRSGYGPANGHNFQIKADLAKLWFNATSADNETFDLTRMVIDKDGNVGIGTDSPGYKLQVGDYNTGDGNIAMKANGTGADEGAELTFNMTVGGGNANSYIAQIVPISYDSLSPGTHNSLNFKVGVWNNNADAGVSRMTILSNGTVGIGTTSPARNLHVHASSNTDIHLTNTASGQLLTDGGTITLSGLDLLVNNREAGNLRLYTNATEKMRISSAGAIKFNAYGAGTLVTDASGNITVSSGGGAGGPYLKDTTDTFTGALTIVGDIRGSGAQLILNAGESYSYATAQTNEYVYANAENGLLVSSSPDNWSSGWAGRNTAYINRADGSSALPGNLSIPSGGQLFLDGGGNTYITQDIADRLRFFTGGAEFMRFTEDAANLISFFQPSAFSGLVTAPTPANATDDNTLATTAFVKNLIAELPAGLIYKGAWNADTNTPTLVAGGGEIKEGTTTTLTTDKLIDSSAAFTTAPAVAVNDRVRVVTPAGPEFALVSSVDSATQLTLASDIVTATGEAYIVETPAFLEEGNYYIVSDDGATDLNGITDWKVGDWVVASSTNVWQKIDNSSVLDGSGTGGKIPIWEGAGASITLGDSVITQSAAGDLDVGGGITADYFRTDLNTGEYSLITRSSAGNAPLYVQSADSSTNQPIAFFSYGDTSANAGTKVLSVAKDLSYFLNTNVGIGIAAPTSKLHINQNVTNPDLDQPNSFAVEIDSNHSGSAATTGDREQGGLFIDVDSSTTGGDTQDEHRLYGIYNTVNHSGDSDLVYALYNRVEQNTTTGTTTNVIGGYSAAISDGGSGAVLTNITGVYGSVDMQDATPVSNSYGGQFLNNTNPNRTGATTNSFGVKSEIQIGSTSAYTSLYAAHFSIDSNAAYTANNSYLLYLDYAGTSLATNTYAIYSADDVKSYHKGNFGIGTDSPDAKLHVLNTNVGVKSTFATAIIENADAQLDITSSSDGTWGSSLNLIEGNGATNTDVWSIARTTSGGGSNLRFNFGTTNRHDNDTKMIIESGGNVGIGTTSPDAKLEVSGSPVVVGNTRYELLINEDNTASAGRGGGLAFSREGTVFGGIKTLQNTSNNDNTKMYFQTRGGGTVADRMVIDELGNVGIGTPGPVEKLYVNSSSGDARIGLNAPTGSDTEIKFSNNGVVQYSIGHDDATDNFVIGTANVDTPKVSINKTGNVGIGTTPFASSLNNAALDLAPAASVWGYSNSVYLNANAYYNNGWLYKSTSSAGVLQIAGNSLTFRQAASGTANAGIAFDQPFVIAATGNVGIGETSPDGILHVNGNGTSVYSITQRDATNFMYLHSGGTQPAVGWNTGSDMRFGTATSNVGASFSTKMTIASNGNVGIGTDSSGSKLAIRATTATHQLVSINRANSDTAALYLGNDTGNDAVIATNNGELRIGKDLSGTFSEYVRIDDAGNVGIGATNPKSKLDVNSVFCVDSKEHAITNAFTTCLTVNLTSHTGCHVVITAFGDWGAHSSAAYRGEFFLQNGANQYNEPGIILRQDDNTSDGTDQIICQIVDPASTANPKDFQIQIRHTDTTSPASFDAQLTYTVQGKFNSIT